MGLLRSTAPFLADDAEAHEAAGQVGHMDCAPLRTRSPVRAEDSGEPLTDRRRPVPRTLGQVGLLPPAFHSRRRPARWGRSAALAVRR